MSSRFKDVVLDPVFCKQVQSNTFNYYQCRYKAKYDGYCGTHSPEKQKERANTRGPSLSEREYTASKKRRHDLNTLVTVSHAIVKASKYITCSEDPSELDGLKAALEPYPVDSYKNK